MKVFDDALNKLKKTAKLLGEDITFLSKPERMVITNFPVKIKGKTEYVTGYRIQHNSLLGPYKGGLRYSPGVDLDEVQALALWMTLKNSLAGLPYGGGKGGVSINPFDLTKEELEQLTRGFARSIHEVIGKDKDIPAPDVNTNAQIMAWFLDEYEKTTGKKEPGAITGKPLTLGGSEGRETSTAVGASIIINKVVKKDKLIVIQGFGNAGKNLASILYTQGYKIIGVGELGIAINDDKGINIPDLIKHKESNGSIKGFADKEISNDELLKLKTDVLIPAAVENVINKDNADEIKAKIIIEVANGPVSDEAELILEKKGVTIYPDVLCNAGGVIVSYFEWVQNNEGVRWSAEEVNKKLTDKMSDNLEKVIAESSRLRCSLRQGAYAIALKRLIEAKKQHGY